MTLTCVVVRANILNRFSENTKLLKTAHGLPTAGKKITEQRVVCLYTYTYLSLIVRVRIHTTERMIRLRGMLNGSNATTFTLRAVRLQLSD